MKDRTALGMIEAAGEAGELRAMAELDIPPSHGRGITPDLVQEGLDRVQELAQEPYTFWTNQFGNPAYADGCRQMGQEILDAGEAVAFVMGVGTGGCLSSVAEELSAHGAVGW